MNNLDDFCRGCYRRGYLENKDEDCELCECPTCFECSYDHPEFGHICYIHPVKQIEVQDSSIWKKVHALKKKDKKLYGVEVDLDKEYILHRLERQHYRCYICKDIVLLKFEKGCQYQFSIDRIDNTDLHFKDNCFITCTYCNCRLFNQKVNNKDNKKVCVSGCHTVERDLPTKWDVIKHLFPDDERYKW